jgi:hypothetical protein
MIDTIKLGEKDGEILWTRGTEIARSLTWNLVSSLALSSNVLGGACNRGHLFVSLLT